MSDVEAENRTLAGIFIRCSIAVIAVVVALFIRQGLVQLLGHDLPPFIIFYPTIMVVALYCGAYPGLLATVLAALLADYWLMPPRGSFTLTNAADAIALALFCAMGVFMSLVAERYRRYEKRIADYKREQALWKSEEALRSSQAKLQGIISSAMDAVVSVDEQQRIVVFNQAAESVFRCPASEAIGSTLDRFIPQSLGEAHREHIRQFGSAGATNRSMNAPGILTAVRSNGEEFPIEATISQVPADGEKLFTVILRDITERKRAEEALQESEERLQLFIEHAPAALAMFDREMLYLSASRRWRTDYGLGDRDLHGLSHYEIFPEVSDEWKAAHCRGLAGEVLRSEADRFDRADGSVQWIRWEIRPWHDKKGEVGGIVIFAEEITERKRAEEALHESQQQFRALADAIPQLCWIADAEGFIFWYNERWYSYTGTTPKQMEGWGWQSVHDPNTLPKVLESWNSSIATGKPFDMVLPLRGADGMFRPFLTRVMPVKDAAGKVVRWFGTNTDVTELRDVQEALRASEQRWSTTLQSIGDAVISTDGNGNVEFMNDVAQRLTGWSLPEAKGNDLSAVFNIIQEVTRTKPENPVSKVIRLGRVIGLANHTALIRRDGVEIPIEDSGAPIRNPEGQIEGVVLVFHDVSEQKKVERALRNSERLATTGRLAATIAHEIHNPLDAVGNLLYLIGEDVKEDTLRQYVSLASQELARVTQMTQQMLTFQREAAKPIPVKIGEILENVIALYDRKIRAAGIHLEQDVNFDGHILALPGELRQVFANLVGNAIEAVGSRHGTITLRAYASRDWQRERSGLRVIVADDGPGIPAGVRASIFEPFFTTKGESGTGLGLWITSDILRKYDGTIRLRTSTQSGFSGTCFSVFLPFDTTPSELT
jgi:PAS domain S-box-containing protein